MIIVIINFLWYMASFKANLHKWRWVRKQLPLGIFMGAVIPGFPVKKTKRGWLGDLHEKWRIFWLDNMGHPHETLEVYS